MSAILVQEEKQVENEVVEKMSRRRWRRCVPWCSSFFFLAADVKVILVEKE